MNKMTNLVLIELKKMNNKCDSKVLNRKWTPKIKIF